MKFYMRDPDRALAGMAGLTLEQIGVYNLILDLLYSRDGVLVADEIAEILRLDPRLWRRLKTELMAKGKIRITTDGLVNANGVTSTLLAAKVRSKSARSAANVRWTNYRNTKQINETAMLHSNASISTSIFKSNSLPSSEVRADKTAAEVDEGDNFGLPEHNSTTERAQSLQPGGNYRSPELAAVMRAKGWIE